MLDIQELTVKDEGRKVVYRRAGLPPSSIRIFDPGELEDGVIVSWNTIVVFVCYGSDNHAKGTSPDHLTFLNGSHAELVSGRAEFWNGVIPLKLLDKRIF